MTLITDQTFRSCSRCGKELTDPASRECGVGPICRGKDNHLYAKTIQANLPAASAIVLGTTPEQFPEAIQTLWADFREDFIAKMARTRQAGALTFTGADFRDNVRTLDLMLSYHLPANLKQRLVKTVLHLGYPGLAAVLSGEASTTKATISFRDGRVWLEGRRNRHGWHAMRAIPGCVVPNRRNNQAPYNAPAAQVEAFISVVMAHWPMYEGNLEEIRAAAAAHVPSEPEPERGPSATIILRSEDFTVQFPWVQEADMRGMINRLKEVVPSANRRWNPGTKTWSVKLAYLDAVKTVLNMVFSDIKLNNTNQMTPANLYTRHNNCRRRYWR